MQAVLLHLLLLAAGTAAALLALPAPTVVAAAATAPASGEHHYRMTGRIRPLLFWVSRDDVGGARLVVHAGPQGTRRFELLIGTAPERAPRKLNRWGYFREEVTGGEATVLGLMTSTNEDSLEEAQRRIARDGTIFGIVDAVIGPRESVARTTTMAVAGDLTYRELDTMLSTVKSKNSGWNLRRVPRPDGVRPGFMTALTEMIARSLAARKEQQNPALLPSIGFVYKEAVYDLHLREARFLPEARYRDRSFTNVLQGSFELRNRARRNTTRFQIAWGTEGPLSGVPVHMVYRPNFWFEAELVLDEDMRFTPDD
jgi:hypothetical protein